MKYSKHIEKGKIILMKRLKHIEKCMMMWKKIKILEMSSYVWELITDLCLHKTFCANLTALVWLNQSLILKLIFNTESQDETISTKFNLLETFQRKEILRYLRSFFEPLNGDLSFGSWTKAAWYFRNCHKKERMCNLVCHTWLKTCIARKLQSFSVSKTLVTNTKLTWIVSVSEIFLSEYCIHFMI